eukprot:SAG31_NODE_1719_length_7455_cov_7.529772_13_plen_69_part_00
MLGLRLEELLALFEPLDDQASHGQLARLPHDLIAEAVSRIILCSMLPLSWQLFYRCPLALLNFLKHYN